MVLMAQCLLVYLLHIFIPTTTIADLELQFGDGVCRLYNVSIGSTFNRARNCKLYYVDTVNITEPSKELFDRLAEGLQLLEITGSAVESVYLPNNVNTFSFSGTPEHPTRIAIDENASYQLQEIILSGLPRLPVNVDKLHSLKSFGYSKSSEAYVDFILFAKMPQLEDINIAYIAVVTLPDSTQLPSLQRLTILNNPITFSNETTCAFPKLDLLTLENNNLLVIPELFTTCAKLTSFTVTKNNIRHIILDKLTTMTNLEFLILPNNQISELKTLTRIQMPRLRNLQLDSNNLTRLDVSQWSMPSLQYLSLGNNKLQQVEGLLTLYSWKMQSLIMADNPLDGSWMKLAAKEIPILTWSNGSRVAEDPEFSNKTKRVN